MENKQSSTTSFVQLSCCSIQHKKNILCDGCQIRLKNPRILFSGLTQGLDDCLCAKCQRCGCFYEDFYINESFEECTRECYCTKN
jgi:hypothetical protein